MLDEMFSQGKPVLGAVDLASGYLFGAWLSPTCDGEAWAEWLRAGQAQSVVLPVVVKDAARGIAAGVYPHAEQRHGRFCALRDAGAWSGALSGDGGRGVGTIGQDARAGQGAPSQGEARAVESTARVRRGH